MNLCNLVVCKKESVSVGGTLLSAMHIGMLWPLLPACLCKDIDMLLPQFAKVFDD